MTAERLKNWIIILYMSLVLYLSTVVLAASLRLNKIILLGIRSDYMLHASMFVPWMILAGWRWGNGERHSRWFWMALTSGLLLISVSEGIQYCLPYRSLSVKDFLANALGLGIGAILSGIRNKSEQSNSCMRSLEQ